MKLIQSIEELKEIAKYDAQKKLVRIPYKPKWLYEK